MEVRDKLQTVLDVIGNRAHPSVLRDLLPKPGVVEENFIRLAVDYLVARELQRVGGPASNQFRLRITETKEVHIGEEVETGEVELEVTDWHPELTQISVPILMAQKRQQYPRAAITVERNYEQVH